jgi:programmed cell death 6-interacting protein
LLREVEDVERMGGTAHLRGILAEVGELRRTVERDLDAAEAALDDEAAADAAARQRHGAAWPGATTVPPSAALAKGLRDKLAQYRSTLSAAGESDGRVIARLDDSRAQLDALTVDAAAALMPRLQAPTSPPPGSDDPAVVVAALRRTVEALERLSAERAALEERARETKAKDNAVLGRLLAAPSPAQQDGIFTEELGKYDGVRAEADRNADASARLAAQLGPQAAAFRAAFAVPAWRSACEQAAQGQRASLKAYREILDHLSEGLRFYMSLQEAVAAHKQQCDDFCFTRALQREEAAGEVERQGQQAAAAAAATAHQQQQAAAATQRMQQMNLASHNPYASGGGGGAPAMHDSYYGHYGGQQQQQQQSWQGHVTPHAAAPPPPPPPPAGHAYGAAGPGYGSAPPPGAAAPGYGNVPQPVHGIWGGQQGGGGAQPPPPPHYPHHYHGGGGGYR